MPRTFSKLTFCFSISLALALVAVITLLSSGLRMVSSSTQSGKQQSALKLVGESNPFIKLQEGRELQANFKEAGTLSVSGAMGASGVKPLALASGDLNRDGYPDLVCGYAGATGGILTLYRGDPHAFAPEDPEVLKGIAEGQFPDPFLKDATVYELPEAPDFLSTGDFNRDGKVDIVVAGRGGHTLYLLEGQEDGGFSQPQWIPLSGSVTAMITGGLNRDGLTDVILGIDTLGGASLLVFDGLRSIFETEPKAYLLPAKASSLALGQLDDDPFEDIAIVANGQILVLHGRDNTGVNDSLASKKAGKLETVESSFNVRAIGLGEFIWDRDSRTEMALLGDDGTVHIVARGELDTRPWTQEEVLQKRLALQRLRDKEDKARKKGGKPIAVAASLSEESSNWEVAEDLPAPAADSFSTAAVAPEDSSAQPLLLSTRMSSQMTDDLLVMNPAKRQLQVVYKQNPTQSDAQLAAAKSDGRSAVSLEGEDEVTAVLPMRVNVDGRPGLVVMSRGKKGPVVFVPLVATTITVNTAADTNNACATTGTGTCSLRDAVRFSNANVGADTIVFSAGINPTLTITSGTGFENAAATGDLDINDSVTITGNAPTTISTIYTSSCGDCKVFGVGQNSTPGLNVSITGCTIQNGFNQLAPASQGLFFETGGGIDFFLFGTGSVYSMTNCTVNNNQVAGTPLLSHGAGINIDSTNTATPGGASAGTVTLTNVSATNNTSSNFGGGIVLAADKHNVTMTDCSATGNTATGADGGGIWIRHSFGGTITMTKTGPGTENISNNSGTQGGGISVVGNQVLSITDATISNNTATGAVGTALGGGIAIVNLGAGSVVGSTTLTGCTISTNHADAGAAALGGGVYFNANYPATLSNCSITSNTSDSGAGVMNGGSGSSQILTLNGGTTISSNTATLVGGGFANINSVSAVTSLAGTTIDSNTSGSGGDGINQAGGTITGSGTNNVNGGDSVNISGGTFNYVSGTFNLTGNFTNSGGVFNQTGGTTVFNGTVAQSLGGTTTSLFNILNVNKTDTLTLGVNTNVGADLTLTAGTFDLSTFTANRTAAGGTLTVSNGTTLKIGGTNTLPSNYTTHSIGATSTIEYSGASQNVAPLNTAQKYGNLLTSGSGTKTLAGNISVATSLTIGSGTTLDASASNFNINDAGNWTNSGTFTPRSATVTFDGGSGTQTLTGNTTFFNLTLNNSGATTAFGATSTTIGNNLVTSAGTMDGGTSTITFTGATGSISGANTKNFNNLVINSGAVITNTTGGNTNISNDYTNNGTFTQAAGLTTTFNTGADGNHSFSGNGTTTFGVVTINGSNTVDAGSHNFNVVGATFTVTGTFTGNTSTVTFNGAVAQSITGNGTKNFSGLTINNANGVTVTNSTPVIDASVSGVLTLTTDLTIASGAILQQSGTSAGGADAIGTVRRTDLGVTARAFGNPNVTIAINSGTAPNPMDVNLVKTAPPDFTTSVTRDYTLTPTGGSGISATLKLHYLDAELNGNAETKLALWKKIATVWTAQGRTGAVDTVNNAVTLSGVGSFSEWTLAQVEPVTITKAFGAASIPLNGITTLTLTLTNPNTTTGLSGIGFSDNFPAGLQVANPAGIGSTCTGTWNATPGDTTLNFGGGTLAPGASCTLTVNVTGTTVGPKSNTTNAPDAVESGTGVPSNTAVLNVVGPPTISKAFGAATIPLGGSTNLTFTITNSNAATALTGVGFTDTLPAGLTVATSGPTTTCGGTLTTTAPGTITLTGATVAAGGGTCIFSVPVTGAAAGLQSNTTGAITSTEGGTGATSNTATITVVAPPSFAKSFNPTNIALNGTSTLTFTITNPNTTVALTGVGFTDTLPAGLTVPNATTSPCGGTLTITGNNLITLTGATIAASGTCTFDVTVTGTTAGPKTNTTGAVTSTNGGTGNAATAMITVATPPTISKAFGVSAVPLGGTTSLTFTITNPNASLGLTGLSFTDTLPAGVTVASSGPTAACNGGSVTTTAPSTITFTGGTLAGGANCMFNVTVTGSTAGVWNNTTGPISSAESGAGATSNTATLTVIGAVSISKSFSAATIPVGNTATLTFTITNPNSTVALTGVAFTDALPSGLEVAAAPNSSTTCGGTFAPAATETTLNFSGGSISAGGTCTVKVDVKGTSAGVKDNTSGNVTSNETAQGNTAMASITVVGPPSIAKSFNPTNIALNGTSTLTFTITNPNTTVALTGVGFTDVLPAGLTVATSGPTTTCGGSLTTTNPSTITLTGATIAASGTCTFNVTVTGTTVGPKTNTTGAVTSTNGGTGNTATAMITIANPPTVTKAFGVSAVQLGGTTSLTFTITNPNTTLDLTGISFTDTLPAGVTVASSGPTAACNGGSVTTTFPSTITFSGGTLGTGMSNSCMFAVTVMGSTTGVWPNTTGAISSNESGAGATSNTATLTVIGPVQISKSFGAATIPIGGTSTLTFTITNPNTTVALTGVAFTDALPSGLEVAGTPAASSSCGGTFAPAATDTTLTFSGGSISAGGTCTVKVDVKGTTAGVKDNTSGNVISNETAQGNTAMASITVVAPPSISKSFNPTSIPVNGTSTLTFTITNPNTTVALTGVGFSDTLPAGLTVATSGPTTTCGGSLTTTNPSTITLTGATIAASGTCMFNVTVTGTTVGVKNNTTGNVTSANGGTGNTASATLSVAAAPTVTKAFGASSVLLGGTTSLTFTITNPNATLGLTGISFSDTLPAGVTVATSGPTPACGGSLTTTFPSTITFTGGTLAGGANCQFSVTVTGATTGVWNNTTGAISSTEGGTGATSNTATLTVIGPPSISKAFDAATIPLGGTSVLTFTISNPNTTTTLTGVAFTDTLPGGLTVPTSGPTAVCGGSLTTTAPNTISFSSGSIAPSSNCLITVTVTGATAGVKNNVSGAVSATNGGTGNTASASITVVAPPSIAKSFNPTNIALNGTSTLTFTITNPNTTVALTGVGFSDTLPAGLTVATSGPTTTCGGSLTTTNPSTITLTGATIAASGTCTFDVTVTGTTVGVKTNTTGNVTSANGGTGNTASATLAVAAAPTVTKSFGASSVLLGGTTSLTFTITNPNATLGLTGISFTDTLPAGVTVATSGPTPACGGSVTTTAPGTITFAGGTLAGGANCMFNVTVTGSTTGVWNNTTGAISSNESAPGTTSNTATLTVIGPPSISKAFGAATIPLGGTSVLTFTITNSNTTTTLTGVAFTDTLPAGLTVPNGSSPQCGGTVTTTAPNTISFSSGSIAPSSNCLITVTVTGATAGVKNNTTGTVSAANGGTGGTSNTATITVVAPPVIAKMFGAANIPIGGTTTLTFTITNPNSTVGLTGVGFTDVLPAGLTVATSGPTVTCGGSLVTTNPSNITLSGASIAASGTCMFSVTVTGATSGTKINTTGAVTSTNGGTGNMASASLIVDQPPVAKCKNVTVSAGANCTANASIDDGSFDPDPGDTITLSQSPPGPYPLGMTLVTLTVTDNHGVSSQCMGTVTVVDTTPPVITCPANITVKTPQAGQPCMVVNYAPPVATDNCPAPTVVCTPPPGTCFPVGTTTVNCTATDASGNTATCTFKVAVFDLCLQDDGNPNTVVLINSFTGDYRFCCKGVIYTGKGTITKQGSTYTLQHNPSDRRVLVKVDEAVHKGSGSIQSPPGTTRCTITDRNTQNNSCVCQ